MLSRSEIQPVCGLRMLCRPEGKKHVSQQSAPPAGRHRSKARANFHPQRVQHKVGVSGMDHEDAL
eukprot:4876069-Amphidinium_carterae.1